MNKMKLFIFALSFGLISSPLVTAKSSFEDRMTLKKPGAQHNSKGKAYNKNAQEISEDQIKEMQEMQQFFNYLVLNLLVKFTTTNANSLVGLIKDYEKDASSVNQKIVSLLGNFMEKGATVVLEQELNEMGADAHAIIEQLKPILEPMLASEIIKWIHVAASSGLKISVQTA